MRHIMYIDSTHSYYIAINYAKNNRKRILLPNETNSDTLFRKISKHYREHRHKYVLLLSGLYFFHDNHVRQPSDKILHNCKYCICAMFATINYCNNAMYCARFYGIYARKQKKTLKIHAIKSWLASW